MVPSPSSEAEDTNEAALDKEAGAGMDAESAGAEPAAETEGLEPGEVENLEPEPDIAEGSLVGEDENEIADLSEAETGREADNLAQNALRDATGTEDPDDPAYVEAPEASEPALDRWEEKEKP